MILTDRKEVVKWLTHLKISHYSIEQLKDNPEGFYFLVNVQEDIKFECEKLDELPIQFGVIEGSFSCQLNNLTTLKGAPHTVKKNFSCSMNQLKNLTYSPHYVGGNFDCSGNQLTTLNGAPSIISGFFDCQNNPLITLEGGPINVKDNYWCSGNPITSFKGVAKTIGGSLIAPSCDIKNLKELPNIIEDSLSLTYNHNIEISYKDIEHTTIKNRILLVHKNFTHYEAYAKQINSKHNIIEFEFDELKEQLKIEYEAKLLENSLNNIASNKRVKL